MFQPQPPGRPVYDREFHGYYGNFGSGANAQISFLQSAISPSDLHKIDLISDIKGAEKWSVRDLFQRDVDVDRVTSGLIPYFKDEGKVKFFNPITLTLLPLNEQGEVVQDIPPIVSGNSVDETNKLEYSTLEATGYFQFKIPLFDGQPSYAQSILKYNSSKIKIVAIDGQHRLSALKRFDNDDDNGDFPSWNIPVVFFSVKKRDDNLHTGSLFDVIRNIFIYINTQAKTPNRARQILLSDESINSVCTQEILEYSHSNDVDRDSVDAEKMPLLFYDWRGEEKNGVRVPTPGSIKQIEEIYDWFDEYICGKDFSAKQKDALDIDVTDPLAAYFTGNNNESIPVEQVAQIRRQFGDDLLKGFVYMLEKFNPYASYISFIRGLEENYQNDYDLAKHAFHKLRFGSHYGGSAETQAIDVIYSNIIQDILDHNEDPDNLPGLVEMDIGMRGVAYAFSEIRKLYSTLMSRSVTWEEYSVWFTSALNDAYETGNWLKKDKDMKLLRHITYNHGGTTVNYRLNDVPKALGAVLTAVISRFGIIHHKSEFNLSDDELHSEWLRFYEDYVERISDKLLSGYRGEHKVLLQESFPQGGKPLQDAVKEAATKSAEKHIGDFTKYLTQEIS